MNGSSNLDETYREFLLAPTDDLIMKRDVKLLVTDDLIQFWR